VSVPTIDYRHAFSFALTPDRLWDRIEEFDQFERWWPWLTGFRIEGNGLSAGSTLHGTVTPPLPYRMQLQVELVECERPIAIDARISGDLVGTARLRLRPDAGGTSAEVAWTVEMRQPAMRLASRIGHPVLKWGHDRVVEITVAGFRRRVDGS
jgi:uncharacterized protein YndB with AHSA1/START domain